ncbi:hypothetical protein [Thiohalophilus sp.]
MNQATFFIPFSGILLLTMLVWLYICYLRLSYLTRAGVHPQQASTR